MEMGKSSCNKGGSLHISIEVLSKIARLAALEISGVAAVEPSADDIKGILSRATRQKPVQVSLQDGIAEITVQIQAKYGCKIQSVCTKVQENVKATVQNMTGITVSKVNVIVVGLQEAAE